MRLVEGYAGMSDSQNPLIDEWMLWQLAARRSERTVEERIRVIRQFADELTESIVTVGPVAIVKWLGRHCDWSDSTAATYHSYLRAWFKWLNIMGYRDDNPMLKLGSPRYPDRVPRPVSDDGLLRLLTTPMHHRTRIMILIAALAGLRVSEIAKVKGEDFDLSRPCLYVTGKGRKTSAIPLHPLLAEVAQTMPVRGWWFPGNNRRPGEHILGKSVSDIIGQSMRRAGVQGTPHSLRHWYGTALMDEGADLRTVQELLRHSSLATTQIYTRVSDDSRTEAINSLNPYKARPRLRPVPPADTITADARSVIRLAFAHTDGDLDITA